MGTTVNLPIHSAGGICKALAKELDFFSEGSQLLRVSSCGSFLARIHFLMTTGPSVSVVEVVLHRHHGLSLKRRSPLPDAVWNEQHCMSLDNSHIDTQFISKCQISKLFGTYYFIDPSNNNPEKSEILMVI